MPRGLCLTGLHSITGGDSAGGEGTPVARPEDVSWDLVESLSNTSQE